MPLTCGSPWPTSFTWREPALSTPWPRRACRDGRRDLNAHCRPCERSPGRVAVTSCSIKALRKFAGYRLHRRACSGIAAFLKWRVEAGTDNAMANRLVPLFRGAGLTDIPWTPQHKRATRGNPHFNTRVGAWWEVAATRVYWMVADGLIYEPRGAAAESEYRERALRKAESRTLHLLEVEGVVTFRLGSIYGDMEPVDNWTDPRTS